MGVNDIAFPNLGIYLHDVPKNFTVFGFTIALYGVIIAIGMMLAVALAVHDRKSRGLPDEPIWDLALIGIPSGIGAGREPCRAGSGNIKLYHPGAECGLLPGRL